MATVRHAAPNIIQGIKDTASLKARRKTLGCKEDCLFKAITYQMLLSSDCPALVN